MSQLDSTAQSFIGKGLTFPIVLTSDGRPPIDGGITLIESSLRGIMSWALGTRFMLGEYGGILEKLLQEANSLTQQSLVKHFTSELISTWEKRVDELDASLISRGEGVLYIQLRYRIKNTKISGSFIFPYYSQLIY